MDRLKCSLDKLKYAMVVPFYLGSCPVLSLCDKIHQRGFYPPISPPYIKHISTAA